jgi:hypothetical protein
VDGIDDFGVVDALEVNRGDAEAAVAKLALDDKQRHAFMGHLHRVRMTQLMRREPAANAAVWGSRAGRQGGHVTVRTPLRKRPLASVIFRRRRNHASDGATLARRAAATRAG